MQTNPASVKEALKDTEYPAEKRDLVEHARLHGASKDVLDDIKNLPDKVYTSVSDVNKELENK
jgi:N-dimethylarginine dimethylaminohydrolase